MFLYLPKIILWPAASSLLTGNGAFGMRHYEIRRFDFKTPVGQSYGVTVSVAVAVLLRGSANCLAEKMTW